MYSLSYRLEVATVDWTTSGCLHSYSSCILQMETTAEALRKETGLLRTKLAVVNVNYAGLMKEVDSMFAESADTIQQILKVMYIGQQKDTIHIGFDILHLSRHFCTVLLYLMNSACR